VDIQLALDTLLAASAVAVLAALVVGLVPQLRIPQVVLLLAGGMLVGPQGLGWGAPLSLQPLADVGLGFVFLLAGYEIDQRLFRQDQGRRAVVAWFVTVALAAAIVGGLAALGLVRAFVPVALALTTTALGTLLPVLRDSGMLTGRLGRYLLAAGAVGELFPILAIAVFLGTDNQFVALASLASVALLAVLLSAAPKLARGGGRLARVIEEGQHATTQTTLRFTVLLLILLLAVTDQFHLDAVLGAFLAGMVLRRWSGQGAPALEEKLDVVGYGFFIPIFFVYSGMTLDLRAIAEAPLRVLLFFALMVVARGLPALLVYRGALEARERVQVMLVTATALPLLVALSEIGLRNGTMLPENAAALVGAGVLTVLVLPSLAISLHRPASVPAASGEPDGDPGPL
jgi:Kef-type K+ transport system membrane component KefB